MTKKRVSSIIKAEVSGFRIRIPFLTREFKALDRLGSYYKDKDGMYIWTFPYENWDRVQNALEGRILEHTREHLMDDVLQHCDPLIKEVRVELCRKGKGSITIIVEGEGYRVTWWQSGEEKGHIVARSLVEVIWDEVISKYKVGEPIPSREIGEGIVRAIENTHWNYPILIDDQEEKYTRKCVKEGKWNHARSQNFDWSKFFGCRGDYHRLFYLPIKCLVALGWVSHRKDGHIIRLSDSKKFHKNARIEEIMLIEKQMEDERWKPEGKDGEKITNWAEGFK